MTKGIDGFLLDFQRLLGANMHDSYIDELNSFIHSCIGGKGVNSQLLSSISIEYCGRNPKYSEGNLLLHRKGISYYHKFYLDPASDEISNEVYINDVGRLLETLWGAGYDAFVSVQFAGSLPRNGGE